MKVEIDGDELIIRIKSKNKIDDLNSIFNYLKFFDSDSNEISDDEILKLSSEININWYKKNRTRLLNEDNS